MKKIVMVILFFMAIMGCDKTAVAELIALETPSVKIVFHPSVTKHDIETYLDNKTALAIYNGEINNLKIGENPKELPFKFTRIYFWKFPLEIISEFGADSFFLNEKKEIEKGVFTEESLSHYGWQFEIGWRIVPLLCLAMILLQKSYCDRDCYKMEIYGLLFGAGLSIFLFVKLGWDGSYMKDYLALAGWTCVGALGFKFAVLVPYWSIQAKKIAKANPPEKMKRRKTDRITPEPIARAVPEEQHKNNVIPIKKRVLGVTPGTKLVLEKNAHGKQATN